MSRFSLDSIKIFMVAGAFLAPSFCSQLQAQSKLPRLLPRMAAIANNLIRLNVSERVTLPFTAVSRVIIEDDETARAYYSPDGNVIIEGLRQGSTTVEIYQSDGTPKLLTIQIGEASASGQTPVPLYNSGTSLPAPTVNNSVGNANQDVPASVPSNVAVSSVPVAPPAPMFAAITPSQSQLGVTLSAGPVVGTAQTQFTLRYSNPGTGTSRDTIVRYALDDRVSYVTDSASNGGTYDASRREVSWDLGAVNAGASGKLTLRIEPIDSGRSLSFDSVATIEDGGNSPINSSTLAYSTAVTPLLTIFALPDRFLAGRNAAPLSDVRGSEFQTAVDRLANIGIIQGDPTGLYRPKDPTQRAEYAVMTLRGLNLNNLRDVTQLKFVLGRSSTVNLGVADENGRTVATLTRNTALDAGEHTVVWDGRSDSGQFVPPGRYIYTCTARDERGDATTLKSAVTLVSPDPIRADGTPSFADVKPTDWYAGYLALGESKGLLQGFPDNTFRPRKPISRVEAAAIVVRALGLSNAAKEWADKNVGFADYDKIPDWGKGIVNATTMLTKTSNGQPIMRGTKENNFEPNVALRRDQAALVVQRIIDRETTRSISVSGAVTPGAVVTINSKPVEADAQGRFGFSFDLNTSLPTTVAVVDTRNR